MCFDCRNCQVEYVCNVRLKAGYLFRQGEGGGNPLSPDFGNSGRYGALSNLRSTGIFRETYEDRTMKNLGDVLRRNAGRYPDREGLVFGVTRLSWEEINTQSNRLAHGLLELDLEKGDRVAILLSNCHQWYEILFALMKTGLVAVPINTRLAEEEIRLLLADSGAAAIFYGEEYSRLIPSLAQSSPILKHRIRLDGETNGELAYDEVLLKRRIEEPMVSVEPGDLAFIAYTGGTTGLPKGVMWPHGTVLETIRSIPVPFGRAFKSKGLIAGSLSVPTQIINSFNYVYCSATVVLMNFDIPKILETIDREKIEIFAGAAAPLSMIANHPDAGKHDLGSLRLVHYGGSSLRPRQLEKIQSVFKCAFTQAYGGTETFINISVLEPYDHDVRGVPEKAARLLSAGRVHNGYEVKLLDEQGKEVPPMVLGEVAVRSGHLMTGYWKKPKETEEAFKDGWFLTRDVAFMDEEGYLFIVDRKNDMIKSGGFSVFPAEVERILQEHPTVAEVAVVGSPDETWGEKIVAVIVLKDDGSISEEELRTCFSGKIASYKIPKQFLFHDGALPKNVFGKIKRREVRSLRILAAVQ